MTLFETVTKILESLSFIATILLVPISIYGLKQLRISKEAQYTQSKRDANKAASEQVMYFLDKVVSNHEIAVDKSDMNILKSFKFDNKNEYKFDTSKMQKFNKKYAADDENSRKQYVSDVEDAMGRANGERINTLEAFAASVLSGVGDEKLVYDSVGITFVRLMKELAMIEYIKYVNNRHLYYKKLYSLYKLWNARYTKEITESMLEDLKYGHKEEQERLWEMEQRIQAIVADEIPPIGVEIQTGGLVKSTKNLFKR